MHHPTVDAAFQVAGHVDIRPCRATRIRIMLTLGRSFTPAQVAYLMGEAQRWGREAWAIDLASAYEQGAADARRELTELNLDAIRAETFRQPFTERWHRMEGYRRAARREADIAASHSWRGDHPGGPVPVWGDEESPALSDDLGVAA
jgi:hypothetical protein